MNNTEFENALGELFSRVVGGKGTLDTEIRLAVANGSGVPEEFKVLTEKVHRHAYRVTDEDVRALLDTGCHQEDVFEAVVSGAVGAAVIRAFATKNKEANDAS